MAAPDQGSGLLSDDPIESAKQDSLDRSYFASRIAKILEATKADTRSAVLGLIGPWGSGKSSMLHLIRESLGSSGVWKVVEFNPWEPAGLDAILRSFFLAILSVFPESNRWKKARKAVAGYANGVRPWAEVAKVPFVDAGKIVAALGALLAGDQSLSAKRKEAIDALTAYGKPILVVIDDVDRLHPDELMLLFKLVRLVGNLPNVYHLLAYDEETVLDVITSTDLARGNKERALDYLEKIVQIRLDLPPVHEQQALALINRSLTSIVIAHHLKVAPDDLARFGTAYRRFMKGDLAQPRSIKRYFGQVEAYLPLVAGEVNFVDFLLITFLRVSYPKAYALVREHKPDLVKTWQLTLTRELTAAEFRKQWEERLAGVGVKDVNGMMQLLRELFLPIKGAVDNVAAYSAEFYVELDRDQRIGSANYFDRYFQFGVPPWDISDKAVEDAAAELKAGTRGQALEKLRAIAADRGDLLLDKLGALASELTAKSKVELWVFLASVYASLPTEGGGIIVLPPRSRAAMLGGELLSTLDDLPAEERVALLDRLLGFDLGVEFAGKSLDNALRDFQEDKRPVPPGTQELKTAVAGRLKLTLEELAENPLEQTSGVLLLLFLWMRLENQQVVQAWVMEHVDSAKSNWRLEDFVGLFTPVGTAYLENKTQRVLGPYPISDLTQMLPIDWVKQRLEITTKDLHGNLDDGDVSLKNRTRAAKRAIHAA